MAEQVAEHGCLKVLQREDAGYTEFSMGLVKELEGAAKKVDIILEEECRDLFSVAATHVFSPLLLCDPHIEFKEVMGHVLEESSGDLATIMESHLRTLLEKLSCDDHEEPGEEPPAFP
ncbi:hypothetical protein D1007_32431 [Hordeum vulgare]|nr:hypothetical protein D1007_32431 [Hordeum vulgare]